MPSQCKVEVQDVLPRPVAVMRVTTHLSTWPQEFGGPLGRVYAALKAAEVKHPGLNVMVYRPRRDGRVDIECGVCVAAKFDCLGEVVSSETPGGVAATFAHIGPYSQLKAGHDAIVDWARSHGRTLSGTCWEVYGHWNDDPAKLRTDLYHLLLG